MSLGIYADEKRGIVAHVDEPGPHPDPEFEGTLFSRVEFVGGELDGIEVMVPLVPAIGSIAYEMAEMRREGGA